MSNQNSYEVDKYILPDSKFKFMEQVGYKKRENIQTQGKKSEREGILKDFGLIADITTGRVTCLHG